MVNKNRYKDWIKKYNNSTIVKKKQANYQNIYKICIKTNQMVIKNRIDRVYKEYMVKYRCT